MSGTSGFWVPLFVGLNELVAGVVVARLLGWWQSHLWGVVLAGAVRLGGEPTALAGT